MNAYRTPDHPASGLSPGTRRAAIAVGAGLMAGGVVLLALLAAGVVLPWWGSAAVAAVSLAAAWTLARRMTRPAPPQPAGIITGSAAAALAWRVTQATGVEDRDAVAVLIEIMRAETGGLGLPPPDQLGDDSLAILADRAVGFWADLGHPSSLARYRAITNPRMW